MSGITVSGAYGRDYKSKAAALADWHDGRDFISRGLHSGYLNNADAEHLGLSVTIRYDQDRRSVVVTP